MPRVQTSCPNCQTPIVADLEQVIDVGRTPHLKDLLLSGGLNFAGCQACGFQGQLPVPIVYHDPTKEILLTYSPPDLDKSMEEKEAALAPLLKKIIDHLDPKDRKGYLFQPKTMLSMNSLIKNILLEDGITEEMIQSQQEKVKLMDELFAKEGDDLINAVREHNQNIDRDFFAIFADVAQRIIASRDEDTIKRVQDVQEALLNESDVGKEIRSETKEMQAATQSLEALGNNLTRESLLELVIDAPSNERVKALTSLVRPAMDYQFFQMMTERIENLDGQTRKHLIEKRNLMLKLTQEIDQKVQERMDQSRELIERLIVSESLEDELLRNLGQIDQFFIQALSSELEFAGKDNNKERKDRLQLILAMVQEITTPPELKVLDLLLSSIDDKEKFNEEILKLDKEIVDRLNEYLVSAITTYQQQVESGDREDIDQLQDTLEKLQAIHNAVLKHSMRLRFKGE